MARLFATSSALALLALPAAAMAQGVVITTPQAGYTVPAGTTYLQINNTTITGNVVVPKGVTLAPGTGSTPNVLSNSASALRVAVSTLNGAIVNAGTILASSPLARYGRIGIYFGGRYFGGGSTFSNSGGAATGITNTGLIEATQSFPSIETDDGADAIMLLAPTNFGTITNAGTILTGFATVASGEARAIGIEISGSQSGTIVNSGTITGIESASVGRSAFSYFFGIALVGGGSARVTNAGLIQNRVSATSGNYAVQRSAGILIAGGISAMVTNTGLIQQNDSFTITNTGTAGYGTSIASGLSLTASGGTSTMNLTTAPGNTVAMSVLNAGTIGTTATGSGPAVNVEAFGIRLSATGGSTVAPRAQAYGATLTGTFTNSGLITVTSVMSGAVPGQFGEPITSAFQVAANGGQLELNAPGPINALATGGVLNGTVVNTGTFIALSIASGDTAGAFVDSGFAIAGEGGHTIDSGSSVTGGTVIGGITNAGLISVTVVTAGTNSQGTGAGQAEAFSIDSNVASALAANSRATGGLFIGNVVNTGTITSTSIGLNPQGSGLFVTMRGGKASGTSAQATGGTFIGTIINSGTVEVVGSGGTGMTPNNPPSLNAMVINVTGGIAEGAGATATGGTVIGNIINTGRLFASLSSVTGTAAGIVVGHSGAATAGVFQGGITNSGVVVATASGGATAAGVRLFIPVPGGITNTGTIEGSTNALDFSRETGGSTAFLPTAGLLVGGIKGNGGDSVTIAGGTLALSPSSKVSGLANFTLGSAGTLALQVTPSAAPSVTAGTVNLAGALQVSGLGLSEVFRDVIVGNNSLSGAFSSVASLTPGVRAGVVPDATTPNALDLVALSLQQGGNFAELLRLGLEQPEPLWTAIQSRMVLSGGTAGASGTLSASLNGAGGTVLADAAATGSSEAGGLWARGYGAFGTAPGTANGSGFDVDHAGVIVGGDWQVAQGIVVGGAFDYGHSSVSFGGGTGSMSVDGYEIAGYAGWRDGPWYANGVAAAGWNEYGTTRTVLGAAGASGSTSGMSYSGYGETGYGLAYDDLRLTPYASLGYVHAQVGAFTESGGESAFAVHSASAASLASTLGLRASLISLDLGPMGTWMPEVRAGWQHEFLDAQHSIGLSFAGAPGLGVFSVTGSNFGRDSAVVGLSVSDQVTSSARIYLNYDGQFTVGGYNNQAVSGGVRVRF